MALPVRLFFGGKFGDGKHPAFLLRLVLGEMSVLLTEGRYSHPKRLIELGFQFRFGKLEEAMEALLSRKPTL